MDAGTGKPRPPEEVVAALADIGQGVRLARLRRRQTARELADRVGISLRTLQKLERGDPGVALGTFATALWVLDPLQPVREAVSPQSDRVAAALEASRVPKRARRRREDDLDRL